MNTKLLEKIAVAFLAALVVTAAVGIGIGVFTLSLFYLAFQFGPVGFLSGALGWLAITIFITALSSEIKK